MDTKEFFQKMDTKGFVQLIKQTELQPPYFYHFTDEANLDSIKSHGILSTDERKSKGIEPKFRGGNVVSFDADDKNEITDFVSLCFTESHPLCFLAHKDDRLPNPRYLKICPEILLSDGVMFADGVANKNETIRTPILEAIKEGKIDYEVIYECTDPDDVENYNRAKKTEILVPKCVPQNMIIWDI